MNDPETFPETISRHFDDANDPAQTALLSEQIKADPEAAISFARAARVHGMLQQSLAPAITKSRRWKPLLWIGSAAAVVIGSFLAWKWAGPHEDAQTKVRITHITDEKDEPKETLTKTIGKVRRVKPAALSANAPDVGTKPIDLNNYFVDLDIHGMTVENALASLKAAISEVNYFQRPWLEQLQFLAVKNPQVVVASFLSRSASVQDLLKVIAMHSRFEMPEPSTTLKMFALLETKESGVVDRREFDLPSNFAPRIIDIVDLPMVQRASPGPIKLEDIDFRTLAETRFGIPLADNESIDYPVENGKVKMHAETTKLARFAACLDVFRSTEGRSGDQIQVSQVLVNCPEAKLPQGFDQNSGMLMNTAQFAEFKTSLFEHGNEVISTPKLITRSGQRSQISVEKEVPFTNGNESEFLWLGQRCDLDVKREGELISCVGKFDLRSPPVDDNEPISPATVRASITEFETYIPNGQTVVFTLDAPREKGILMCCMTVQKLLPSGEVEALKEELPFGVPVTNKPGFLFSPYAPDKGMIDVRGIPSGTKVACPYTQKIFRVP